MNNTEMTPAPTLHGREFVMESSTASTVNTTSPTRFRYHQHNAMIWGEYVGDTVSIGRFMGRREGQEITISFVHADAVTGQITRGSAVSMIETGDDGLLRLIEDFPKDGVLHHSVCIESASEDDWADGWGGVSSAAEASDLSAIDKAADVTGSPSIDEVHFVLESSTASEVAVDAPSHFVYREASGIIWGDYDGDTVTFGHFVGVREGNALSEAFVHEVVATDATLVGESGSRIERRADGRLELIEEFVLDGVSGRSVCVEMSA